MTTVDRLVMPAPPAGMVWVLEISATKDDAAMWLYRERRFHKGVANDNYVACSILPDRGAFHGCLRISTASIDRIVEAAIMAADELLDKMDGHSEREAQAQARATDISTRLGIEVRVSKQ